MESGNTLITFIINHGDAYDVMAVAREAGAKGGTILNAHGTRREEDISFFGMHLASEKDMLLIMAEKDAARKILDAVKKLPLFKKAGGGVIYTNDVTRITS